MLTNIIAVVTVSMVTNVTESITRWDNQAESDASRYPMPCPEKHMGCLVLHGWSEPAIPLKGPLEKVVTTEIIERTKWIIKDTEEVLKTQDKSISSTSVTMALKREEHWVSQETKTNSVSKPTYMTNFNDNVLILTNDVQMFVVTNGYITLKPRVSAK